MEFTMLLRYVRIMKLMLVIFILYVQCSRERIQLRVISKKTVFYWITRPPRWPSSKVFTSRAEGPGFESRLRRYFSGVKSYQ